MSVAHQSGSKSRSAMKPVTQCSPDVDVFTPYGKRPQNIAIGVGKGTSRGLSRRLHASWITAPQGRHEHTARAFLCTKHHGVSMRTGTPKQAVNAECHAIGCEALSYLIVTLADALPPHVHETLQVKRLLQVDLICPAFTVPLFSLAFFRLHLRLGLVGFNLYRARQGEQNNSRHVAHPIAMLL